MKRSPIKKRLGRKRRTSHSIPMLPSRMQDGSAVTRVWHTAHVEVDGAIDLRQLAKGQPCYLPIDQCSSQETVVLAHIRRGHIAGMGQRPADVCAMPMCHRHHAMFDGRERSPFTRTGMDASALDGLCRWLAHLWNNGYLKT